MARTFGERFGDDAYAFEELVAELGSAFTMARLGLTNTPRSDHAIYLGSWLQILNTDSKALFAAASHAQRAVNYIADLVHPTNLPSDTRARRTTNLSPTTPNLRRSPARTDPGMMATAMTSKGPDTP